MGDGPAGIRRGVLFGAFALSGAAALAYEVVWTRALSVVLGSSTYALSSILATFMLGLAIGGLVGGRLADRGASALVWFAGAELGIGALGIASHLVIESLPSLYLPLFRFFHFSAPMFFAAQVVLCSLVMLLPTILMGMTFPLVTRAAIVDPKKVGATIGAAYGANTLGSVCGALVAGFGLVPGLGLRGATLAAAGANLVVAIAILLAPGARRGRALLLLAPLHLALGAAALGAERQWTLVNFYSAWEHLGPTPYAVIAAGDRASMEKLYERDGIDGHVAAFRLRSGHLILQVGGKIEGTGEADVPNTLLLAYLPIAAGRAPERMLVIGLGAGSTLAAARGAVPRVDLAEINENVIEVVRRHGPPGLLDGVRILRDDARNALLRSEERWDAISSEPSYPTDFAVANLFSVEFYELAARRLSGDGVFCQWLPYYMLTDDDVTMMVKTFASVFPHVTVWKATGSKDLLLLGSRARFARGPEQVVERVRELNSGVPLPVVLSRSSEQVGEIARRPGVPLNTDDRPRLEFRVARNFRVADLAGP